MPSLTKDDVQAAYFKASNRYADLENQVTVGLIDHSMSEEDYKKKVADRNQAKFERDSLFDQLNNWDDSHKNIGNPSQKTPAQNSAGTNLKDMQKPKLSKEEKRAQVNKKINDYVHAGRFLNAGDGGSGVSPTNPSGITSTTVSPTIPEEIIYNPSSEVNSVVDLSQFLTKTPVTTASGTYPVLKRADQEFHSVEELQENPKLGTPEFTNVRWSVDTRRGAIPISQEAIDDSEVDVSGIVTNMIAEQKVNTYNDVIASKMKEFSAASANNDNLVDAFKWLLNVGLDPAYNPSIIVSQTLYNALDTLKDNQGHYIFHQDITSKSGDTLLGVPVHRVSDTILGQAGEAHAWIGDLGRAFFFPNRLNINLAWQWSQIYGYYLAGVMRFGLSMADAKAGYFLNATIPAQSIVKPDVTTKDNPDEVKKKDTSSSETSLNK